MKDSTKVTKTIIHVEELIEQIDRLDYEKYDPTMRAEVIDALRACVAKAALRLKVKPENPTRESGLLAEYYRVRDISLQDTEAELPQMQVTWGGASIPSMSTTNPDDVVITTTHAPDLVVFDPQSWAEHTRSLQRDSFQYMQDSIYRSLVEGS